MEVDLCKYKHSSAEMKMYNIPQLQSWAEFLNVGDLGNKSNATLSCKLDFVVLGNLIKIIFVSK